jgi:hypothetical protein
MELQSNTVSDESSRLVDANRGAPRCPRLPRIKEYLKFPSHLQCKRDLNKPAISIKAEYPGSREAQNALHEDVENLPWAIIYQ